MLALSTAHITEETADLLWNNAVGLVVYEKPGHEGCFVLVCNWTENQKYVPDDLRACLELAAAHNCDWLNLDRDADVVSLLPAYEW